MSHFLRLTLENGNSIAYHKIEGRSPGILFLSGFRSDMFGTKAEFLAKKAAEEGRAFVRFDYSGHGLSSGDFIEGTISQWLSEARQVLEELTEGPQIVVGSSMGGWIGTLMAMSCPRVVGFVGIATACDFTLELVEPFLTEENKASLDSIGKFFVENPYGEPTPMTAKLLEDGRQHAVLSGAKLPIHCPVHLLHGCLDVDVPVSFSERLAQKIASDQVTVHLIKEGDHRLSSPFDLRLLGAVVSLMDQPPVF